MKSVLIPSELREFGLHRPPQSWMYAEDLGEEE